MRGWRGRPCQICESMLFNHECGSPPLGNSSRSTQWIRETPVQRQKKRLMGLTNQALMTQEVVERQNQHLPQCRYPTPLQSRSVTVLVRVLPCTPQHHNYVAHPMIHCRARAHYYFTVCKFFSLLNGFVSPTPQPDLGSRTSPMLFLLN
jgi:hypothetical protein